MELHDHSFTKLSKAKSLIYHKFWMCRAKRELHIYSICFMIKVPVGDLLHTLIFRADVGHRKKNSIEKQKPSHFQGICFLTIVPVGDLLHTLLFREDVGHRINNKNLVVFKAFEILL